MRNRYLVGNDDYDTGWDEYGTLEDAESAALQMAQDEEQGAYIYKAIKTVVAEYRVVDMEDGV